MAAVPAEKVKTWKQYVSGSSERNKVIAGLGATLTGLGAIQYIRNATRNSLEQKLKAIEITSPQKKFHLDDRAIRHLNKMDSADRNKFLFGDDLEDPDKLKIKTENGWKPLVTQVEFEKMYPGSMAKYAEISRTMRENCLKERGVSKQKLLDKARATLENALSAVKTHNDSRSYKDLVNVVDGILYQTPVIWRV